MKKIYVLVLGALLSMSHAQLMVSEKIYQQMDAREKTHVLKKTQKASVQEEVLYTVAGEKEFKSGKNFKVEKLGNFHRFTMDKKNKKKRAIVSEAEMSARAMDDLKTILPKDVADSCAITSVGYEYEQRDSNEPRVVGSMVMAHRKLDGVPVRGASYVLMNYDSTGNLSYMDVQWNKIEKVPAKSTIEKSKRDKKHRADFNELVENIAQDFRENNIRGSLDNSVQTLVRMESEDGDVMLVPSVTFIGQYSKVDGDESIPMMFDIPTDASLVPANKAIVSR